MLDLNQKYLLNDDIVLRKIDDKCWALNTSNGNQYRLNEVSYSILDSFRETTSFGDMISKLQQEYSVNKERLITDCTSIVQYAVNNNIVKEV